MNFKKNLLIAIIGVFFSASAFSALLLEPYAGYDFSLSGKQDSIEYKWSGFEFGARLGLVLGQFMFGVDGDYKGLTPESTVGGANTKTKSEMINGAGFVGGMWKTFAIRGKYYFRTDWKLKEGAASGKKYQGTGFGLDIAFRLSKIISLNLEYSNITYNKFEKTDLGTKIKTSDLLLAISMPFQLFGGRR